MPMAITADSGAQINFLLERIYIIISFFYDFL